jgi:glycosyltransferase involved in cell wall biosynthesis
VQNKVLEAMALGVPVVATPAAIEGIEVCNGEDVLIATSAEQFAEHVIQLLSNSELRKTMTKKAWNKMNQFYHWDLIGSKLEDLLRDDPAQDNAPTGDDVSVGLR